MTASSYVDAVVFGQSGEVLVVGCGLLLARLEVTDRDGSEACVVLDRSALDELRAALDLIAADLAVAL